MLGLNLLLPHSPGQSSHRSLDHSPANYEGYGKAPLPGLFPHFSEHFGTVKSCENVTESWESCSICKIHSRARSHCLPPPGRSPEPCLGRICFSPLCLKSLDHSAPPGQAYVPLTAQHPPGWVSATQVPSQAPSWIPLWYQHFSFRLCSLSLCAGGLLWSGEPRGTKEPNSGSATCDLLLPHSLHICMLLN